MTLFVDTSVWSRAFRDEALLPEIDRLAAALDAGELVTTTGIVLQELLQGFTRPSSARRIREAFDAIPFIEPARSDYVDAAALRNRCRERGVQVSTIDALLAQLCIANALTMLSTDIDFDHIARVTSLQVWNPS